MLFGGPALFVLARAGYLRLVVGAAPRAQLWTVATLVGVGAAALTVPALVAALAAVAILAGPVTVEHVAKLDQASPDATSTSA